jgi:hypothetical protein
MSASREVAHATSMYSCESTAELSISTCDADKDGSENNRSDVSAEVLSMLLLASVFPIELIVIAGCGNVVTPGAV